MKRLSLILVAIVLFAGVSFAKQQSPDPAKTAPKSDKKSDKKAPAKKSDKKSDKKSTATPAAK